MSQCYSHCETDDKQRSLLTSQDYVLDTFNQIQIQINRSNCWLSRFFAFIVNRAIGRRHKVLLCLSDIHALQQSQVL